MNTTSVMIKSNRYGLTVYLDPSLPFDELALCAADKFKEAAPFFKNAKMALTFTGRLLNKEQERELIRIITENSGLHILCLVDERKEEEDYYKAAVNRALEEKKMDDGQFYRGTLRSGQVLETEASVVILGDVNPGAQVISRGNIVVLGCCMGSVYAGAGGDSSCFAAGLVMKPAQVRIADKMARSAIVKRSAADSTDYAIEPKIAYIRDGHIYVKPITNDTMHDFTA